MRFNHLKHYSIIVTINLILSIFIILNLLSKPIITKIEIPNQSLHECMIAIQKRVGCEKIDGEIGPETTAKYNAAWEEESKKRAVKTMEKYGAGIPKHVKEN